MWTIASEQQAHAVQADGLTLPLPRRVALLLSGILVAVFVDLWLGGPLKALDVWLSRWTVPEDSVLRGPFGVLDSIGLRGVTVPILIALVLWLRRQTGRWRPLGVAVVTVLAVNVAIGSMKVLAGRGRPSTQSPDLFTGDVLWPSGHAANIVITGGLIVYLLRAYGHHPIGRWLGMSIVAVPSLLMATVSVALGYHWLSDLLAGAIVGLLVVGGVTSWDASATRRHHSDIVGRDGPTGGTMSPIDASQARRRQRRAPRPGGRSAGTTAA